MQYITSAGSHISFVDNLSQHHDRVALVSGSTPVTYEELAARVAEFARRLGPTRRLVMVEAGNDPAAIVAHLGALAGGHVVLLAPADDTQRRALLDTYRPDVEVRGVGEHQRLTEHRAGTGHDLHPDLALVMSTSGSTGSPKAVRLSHRNLQSNAAAIAEYLELSDRDRGITTLPLHYCYGLSVLHSHLLVGASLVLSTNSVVDGCFWSSVRSHRVTGFAGVPHTFDLLERVGFADMEVPSLRYLTQAGGRLAPEKVERFARLAERDGWDLFVMYGQTEATARMAYLPPELALRHPDSIGVAVPGGSFELAEIDGSDERELVYRGPNVMMGYARAPADLARGHELDALRTGDLARCSAEGLFTIVGRVSRFTKLFGLRVDLDRVESQLAEVGIDALCTGDDERLSVAVVDADPERVRRDLAQRLALPPGSIVVVPVTELPRLANGKADHATVRELAQRSTSDAPSGSLINDGGGVRGAMAEALGVASVADDDTFVSLGGDSLSYVELSVTLEQQLGRLPANWHVTPVAELERASSHGASWMARIDTTILLRAVGIFMVVASHASLFRLRGGAHVLLAVAGFNYARFQLDRRDADTATSVASIARIAVPAVAWFGLLALWSDEYDWHSVALLNSYLGPHEWSAAWRFWFVEALVLILVVLTALRSIPRLRRLEREHPIGVPAALLATSLVVRFDVVTVAATPEPLLVPHMVAWCFLLGWMAQRATTLRWQLVVSVAAIVSVPGFFGEPSRDLVVLGGLLLLVWVRSVPVPRVLLPVLGVVASASLYIYLTHFDVYLPMLERDLSPLLAVAASFAAGVAAWWLLDPRVARLVSMLTPRRRAARVDADVPG